MRTDQSGISRTLSTETERTAHQATELVPGDGRLEVAWTKGGNDSVHRSNFAPGADDGQLNVPAPPATQVTTVAESLSWTQTFQDDYEGRAEMDVEYTAARGHENSWAVADGVLAGQQAKADHGAGFRR